MSSCCTLDQGEDGEDGSDGDEGEDGEGGTKKPPVISEEERDELLKKDVLDQEDKVRNAALFFWCFVLATIASRQAVLQHSLRES